MHVRSVGYFTLFVLVAASLGVAFQEPCLAKSYIKIRKTKVNVRAAPSTSANVITKAFTGDIFELEEERSAWYAIHLFSGDVRYVHKSMARKTGYTPAAPENLSVRQEIFRAWIEVETKVQREAAKRYPPDASLKKNIEYSRILTDRYKLRLMHKFQVQPPVYRRIAIEGFQKGW